MSCDTLPYLIDPMTSTFSSLLAVLAGFALAGVFLVIDQVRNSKSAKEKAKFSVVVYMLFVSFITGMIASYKFAALSGEDCTLSFFTFIFPSAIFAIHIQTLFSGICILISGFFEAGELYNLTRHTAYIVILVASDRIYRTIEVAYDAYWDARSIKLILIILAIIPFAALLLRYLGKNKKIIKKIFLGIQQQSIQLYGYLVIGVTIFLGVMDSFIPSPLREQPPQYLIAIVTMGIVSILGTWAILRLPIESG